MMPTLVSSRSRRITMTLLRPALLAIVVGVAAALVAAGVLPLVAGAGVAVKLADTRIFAASDRAVALPVLPQRSTIYAADGTVLATVFRGQNREVFPFGAYNTFAKDAVLSIEDHTFYEHGGVDLASIFRALLKNLRAGRIVQGGSTLTQQLVKNTQTGGAQTLQRKILEAQDALRMEATYSKDEVFEAYLNTIYMGNSVYGYGTAAGYYFDRLPSNVTLPQAATLAGLIAAPEYYNPLQEGNLDVVKERRNEVLQKMLQYHKIDQDQYQRALEAPVKVRTAGRTTNLPGPQPYWVDYIRHLFLTDPRFGRTEAEREYLWYQGGLKIHTTLNLRIQRAATRSLDEHYSLPTDPQAAAVTINAKTGAILAMANGNTTYGTGPGQRVLSLAWQAKEPTGSAFKVYTLAAALEAGIQTTSQWKSKSPRTIKACGGLDGAEDWTVHNAEPAGGGLESLAVATADSTNVVFAQIINQIGPDVVRNMARRMGVLGGDIAPVCPITLGNVGVTPLAMTAGVQTLANDGVHCMPYAISRVVRDGRTVFQSAPNCRRVLPESIAATETSMLEKVICCGTAAGHASLPDYPARPEAGKTGTGDDFKNAYFVGYVPQVVTGVWVGDAPLDPNVKQRSLDGLHGLRGFGADLAAPIWTDVMAVATARLPIEQFPTPPAPQSGIVPSVVGLQKDEAIAKLGEAKFSPDPVEGPCLLPIGTVCQQDPLAGSLAPLGTTVTITVSNGQTPTPSPTPSASPSPSPSPTPAQKKVPDVVGKERSDAAARLRAAGFRVSPSFELVRDHRQDDIVLSQNPPGDTLADEGSTVAIIVGKFRRNGNLPGGQGAPDRRGGTGPFPPWAAAAAAVVIPLGALGVLRSGRRRRPRWRPGLIRRSRR
jgi:membrane peptidoglycan carboxypeptidase